MIDINLGILVAQIVTFLIAVFVLWKIAWGPLTSMLKERQNSIMASIEKTKLDLQEAEDLKIDYEQKLKQVSQDAQKLFLEARHAGQHERDTIVNEARMDAKRIAASAKRDLAEEKERMIKELRQEVAMLAVAISEKLIEKSIDKNIQDKVFKKSLDDLKS